MPVIAAWVAAVLDGSAHLMHGLGLHIISAVEMLLSIVMVKAIRRLSAVMDLDTLLTAEAKTSVSQGLMTRAFSMTKSRSQPC